MNKLNISQESSLKNNESKEENKKNNERHNRLEKVLCNHCGRNSTNGIRCLGICVADNDY
tara:strand:- start:500 stop:679 length:180 start_codon:yes stop_codon:yes gene_type:complete